MSLLPANYASVSALCRGVEARLRSAAVLNDLPGQAVGKFVGVQPRPGKPPRAFGQFYLAVSWAGGRGGDQNPQGHYTLEGITVTITARLNYAPRDRQGLQITSSGDLYDLANLVAGPNIVHGNYDVLTAANALIPGTAEQITAAGGDPNTATVNGFQEPLVLGSYGPEREATPDWIGAADSSDVYVIDVTFREAGRQREYLG